MIVVSEEMKDDKHYLHSKKMSNKNKFNIKSYWQTPKCRKINRTGNFPLL